MIIAQNELLARLIKDAATERSRRADIVLVDNRHTDRHRTVETFGRRTCLSGLRCGFRGLLAARFSSRGCRLWRGLSLWLGQGGDLSFSVSHRHLRVSRASLDGPGHGQLHRQALDAARQLARHPALSRVHQNDELAVRVFGDGRAHNRSAMLLQQCRGGVALNGHRLAHLAPGVTLAGNLLVVRSRLIIQVCRLSQRERPPTQGCRLQVHSLRRVHAGQNQRLHRRFFASIQHPLLREHLQVRRRLRKLTLRGVQFRPLDRGAFHHQYQLPRNLRLRLVLQQHLRRQGLVPRNGNRIPEDEFQPVGDFPRSQILSGHCLRRVSLPLVSGSGLFGGSRFGLGRCGLGRFLRGGLLRIGCDCAENQGAAGQGGNSKRNPWTRHAKHLQTQATRP